MGSQANVPQGFTLSDAIFKTFLKSLPLLKIRPFPMKTAQLLFILVTGNTGNTMALFLEEAV